MEVILPILEDERMGLDVLSLTFEGDVALLPDLGHPGKKKRCRAGHPLWNFSALQQHIRMLQFESFLAALAALYLTLVSEWVSEWVSATLES